MKVLKRLMAYMTGRKALLPLALILSALSALFGLLPFLCIWLIVRELLSASPGDLAGRVWFYAIGAAATAVVSVILYFFALSASHLAAFRVEVNLRRHAMNRLLRMPLGFFDRETSGKIRKIIDDNAGITHSFLAHQMPDLAGTLLVPLFTAVLLIAVDWRLGLACIVPVIIAMALMGFMMSGPAKHFMKLYMTSLEKMNTEAVEYVRGIPVVKVFQQTVFSFKSFHDSILEYRKMVTAHTKNWKNPMSLYTVVINGFAFFLIPVAILILAANPVEPRDVIVNVFLYILITPVFSQTVMRSMYISQAMALADEAVTRMETLVATEPLPAEAGTKQIVSHSVEFKNVIFGYPGSDSLALHDISFTAAQGERIALVGPSGGGKTTIARLIPRFWDVSGGAVLVGGQDVRKVDPKELMAKVSFVFQNTRLFKTTLLENIAYGNPKASREDIERAADLAQCREILDRLPEGLMTRIGVEGTYLSGGEQQRFALARSILKDAPIVVLDEATAFADPENEHLIHQALVELTRGKTVIMIAHRLTSVKNADRILVIDGGTIIEEGRHEELLARGEKYASLWAEYQRSVRWTVHAKEAVHVR